jgi:hypothetical protein
MYDNFSLLKGAKLLRMSTGFGLPSAYFWRFLNLFIYLFFFEKKRKRKKKKKKKEKEKE